MKVRYLFTLFILITTNLFGQQITNVQDIQQDDDIRITYDLYGGNNIEQFTVSLYVSLDGRSSWRGPLAAVSGDVGPGIRPGRDKTIIWRVLEEFDELQGNSIYFKVTATYTPMRFDFEPEMVSVKGGTFRMGSNDGDSDEKPIHSVTLSDYSIGKYEVTNAQFCAFLNEKGNQQEGGVEWINLEGSYKNEKCRISSSGNGFKVQRGYEEHPVIYVSWYGARAFCNWLKEKTGKNYQLPREAQWEFAARGGNKSRGYKYAGSDNLGTVGWYSDNSGGGTQEVGQKRPNELGIYDMSGNVWEWCQDWYGDYSSRAQRNPIGASSGSYRVYRGGSWVNDAGFCRVADRYRYNPGGRYINLGFRVILP